jgi:hypothetical protein
MSQKCDVEANATKTMRSAAVWRRGEGGRLGDVSRQSWCKNRQPVAWDAVARLT